MSDRGNALLTAGHRTLSHADRTRETSSGSLQPTALRRWQNGLMRVVATRIEPDGTMRRRMVDTAQQSDRRLWEDLAARAIEVPVPYRPALGIAIYHVSVDDYVVMAAEYDLAGPLHDLVTAVMALGGAVAQEQA
jgi:hypothetical protein